MKKIQIIDSHTGGEPTRLVIGGFPDLGSGSMADRLALLAANHDAWRATTVLEPRGSDVIVGGLLCKPVSPDAAAGVIFFNNAGYLGMCGHGTIGLVATLAHMGRISPGEHRIETPVGTVTAVLHHDGAVSVRNLPAYRHLHQVAVQVPGYGTVHGDVAWGGNWFFLTSEHGQRVASDNLPALTAYAALLRESLTEQGITGAGGAEVDHIELFADDTEWDGKADGKVDPKRTSADSRNFVLCPGLAYDRSPCGTGTSAKLACLAADGKLAPGELWHQASVIGSRFEASYSLQEGLKPGHVVPTIKGRAYISAEATLLIADDDPFGWGIRL